MGIGFQVLKRKRAVSLEMAKKFAAIPCANISDSMNRLTAGGPRLQPYHEGGVMAGPALTVKTAPGDNLLTHMALNLAQPGDVIVVDAGGDCTNAIIGERMIVYCQRKGFAGIVINGAIRDVGWVGDNEFPVYAAGVTHRGPYKNGPGEINVPIAIDGMVIEPGDLVVGDDDGLLCIPYAEVDALYPIAAKKHKDEADTFDAIGQKDNDRAKWEKMLRDLGCSFEE